MNLPQAYIHNGITVFIDDSTGEAFATVKSYATIAGIHKGIIRKRFDDLYAAEGSSHMLRITEVMDVDGLRVTRLIGADLVYQWLTEDNLACAKAADSYDSCNSFLRSLVRR
jgi:hypothetical protein